MLGKAGGGAKVFLLDEDGNLINEPDVIGELCVVSPWLAFGYNALPEETAAKFTDCPFLPGERMYRSGDYMAYDKDGNLLFHGRRDRMIKLRGYRVELGEIENVLSRSGKINEAACVAVKVSGGDKICCYYSSIDIIDPAELKEIVKHSLPEYMIPDYFVRLDALPRNERSKINYRALEAMEPPVDEGDYTPPENDLEKRICDEFAEVLKLKLSRVSALADFFELGGTSLTVALLIAKLKDLRPGLAFNDIVRSPTPRALAQFLSLEVNNKSEAYLPKMDRDFYPLTRTQMGIYLEAMTGGSAATYTTPYLMRAAENINPEELIAAVKKVIAAHPSMKYIIKAGADGIPHMFMTPDAVIDIPVIDGTEDDRLEFMKRFMPVVPMTDKILFYFAVYRTPERCYLAMKSHLIFFDGTSISLLISEINRALTGKELLKEEYTVQQVGMYEEKLMRDGSYDAAKKYHEELFKKMDDIAHLTGDLDGALTPGISKNFRYEPKTLKTERVRAFCELNQITESSFFMSAMALMLGKYLNSKHVSFSTVYNGRALSEMNNTMGTLIKRVPVYGDLSENISVSEFLKRTSRQIFSNMSNDIYSFDEILKSCPVNEDVEFIYQGDLFTDKMGTDAGENLVEGDAWFMEHYHTGMVTGCLSIQFFSTGGLYNMTLEYRNERFSSEWVNNFAEDLFTIAEGLLTHERIGDIEMLTALDKEKLKRFNDTDIDINFTPVHEQIRHWAEVKPDGLAVTAAGEKLTFSELNYASDIAAAALKSLGVTRDVLVGVLFGREVRAYVAEIGILKAGGAFVPFIPDYPDERINFCMEDGKINLLLTTDKIKSSRPELLNKNYKVVTIEDLEELEEFKKSESVRASDLAYCIYTSGTTGRPKGVMIEHGNIANYVHRNEKSLEIMNYAAPGRVCLALASFSFDVSVVEEFVPLCSGNPVVIATEEEIHTPALLADLIKSNGVNGITCTPTYLLNLLDIPETRDAIRELTFFDIGAEAFPAQLYDRLRELRTDSVILNVYDPTEATMGCAAEEMTSGEIVTVGCPIANTKFLVADTFGNELPVGIKGELIICGAQVGRGYINLPDKTKQSFFIHDGLRAYHSGDLAAWTSDGKIKIFGRVDNQIKLRGFRIELDEIEKVMGEYPGVKTCTAAVQKNNGAEYLIGYYTAQGEISPQELKKYMQGKLPEYMIPTALTELKSMPMTSSGKVDKKALPLPDFSAFRAEYIAPENDTERALCMAFAHALKLPENEVGVLDDFFELGGDSLSAMAAMADAGIESLTPADIFQKRTPKAIAEALTERLNQGSLDEREDAARKVPHALTRLQQQMIDNQLFKPYSTMWNNLNFLVRFEPSVDAERLCSALNKALANHPALSSAFFFDDNNNLKYQYIPGLLKEVKVHDIREKELEQLSAALVLPFPKILNSCLCRAHVFRSEKYTYLFMDVHHTLMDGGSLGIVLADIVNAYFGRELKRDYYFSIIADEEQRIANGSREKDREWFMEKYGDDDWCNVPPCKTKTDSIRKVSREKRLSFNAEQIGQAEKYWGASFSVIATSAALIALSRFTGREHVMINWIFNNRLAPEAENTAGMLIKNLPAALRMEEFNDLRGVLMSVKDQVSDSIAHSTYDFMYETYQAFQEDCMEVNLNLGINGDELDVLNPEIIDLENDFAEATARVEFILLENEYGDGGFDSLMDYAEGLFDKEQIEAFHDLYIEILEDIVFCREIKL